LLEVSSEFKNAVYAPVRTVTARINFHLTESTYGDDYIIDLKILEEMSTINTTIPSNELSIRLDNTSGEFDFINLQNIQDIIASRPQIDVEFGLEFEDSSIEWVKMGTYYVIEWKNEVGAMSITFVARDNFDMLAEVSYHDTSPNNLFDLAWDVLQNAGIRDFEIDSSLSSITTEGFVERLDSRTALQHIGIASKCAVFQDRTGKIIIKPFAVLDQSSNFLVYCGQPNAFAGVTYPQVNSGFDMKNIDYDNLFQEPEIKLDKSIYEVVVNVYEDGNKREVVYVNSSLSGNNGTSFKIDNPLINTDQQAIEAAQWIISESNYNAIYKTVWRQNPALECADVILVEDSFDAKKQTRIYKQEYEYVGYLKGVTESRGGL
jgi:hypothetical protein